MFSNNMRKANFLVGKNLRLRIQLITYSFILTDSTGARDIVVS
jgi:hypothetical protein